LLLQGLSQFVQQPGVPDGDNSLSSEVLHQFNLFVGERAHFLPVDQDCPDQRVVLDHWYGDE